MGEGVVKQAECYVYDIRKPPSQTLLSSMDHNCRKVVYYAIICFIHVNMPSTVLDT